VGELLCSLGATVFPPHLPYNALYRTQYPSHPPPERRALQDGLICWCSSQPVWGVLRVPHHPLPFRFYLCTHTLSIFHTHPRPPSSFFRPSLPLPYQCGAMISAMLDAHLLFCRRQSMVRYSVRRPESKYLPFGYGSTYQLYPVPPY
jgi:hypothetical protein